MSYSNASAEFRPELHVVVEQSMAVDNKFIADFIFPQFGVDTDTGDFMRILRGSGQLLSKPGSTTEATDPLVRQSGGEYREVTRTEEKDGWKTIDRGLEEPIDDKLKQKVARFFDKESSTARLLMRAMRISKEARVAAKVFNESVWGAATNAVSNIAFTEANLATFDFPGSLEGAKLKIDKRQENANTLVISAPMWSLARRATKTRQYFLGENGGNASVTLEMVAKEFGLDQILVGRSSYDTTKVGKTTPATDSTLVWTWGDDYFWVGNVQGGAPEMGGAGRTFVLEDMTNGGLFVTESYRIEKRRSTFIRVRQDDDTKVINENSGTLVKINNL